MLLFGALVKSGRGRDCCSIGTEFGDGNEWAR
jgi:hypothetical protein